MHLHLDLHVDLQVILQVTSCSTSDSTSNLHDKGTQPWGQLYLSLHSNSSDKTETKHTSFNPVTERVTNTDTPFDKAVTDKPDISWKTQADVSRNRHEQTFIWRYRSSIRLTTNSTHKSTLRSTHKSTSRSEEQSTCKSTRNLQADLQAVQHLWVQAIHNFFFLPIQFHIWFIHSQVNTMAHLAGIDKGPVLYWTDDNGLMECFRKWKKRVEILFWGPLTNANDTVKCNYIIYWSGETGMEVVDKWETEEKITDINCNNIARYFELFEHISPKSNTLITIVELKRLFQESMSLEDFHTKALRLVKEAEYPEGATWNRILQDTIISGLASDNIRAKIIKEDKDVTPTRVMEIACLEVSTQKHLDQMQETAKVNYVQYGKGSKSKKCKPRTNGNSGSGGSSVNAEECSGSNVNACEPKSKGKKSPLPTDICWRCKKARHKKGQICKALELICRSCRIKGHYEKVCMKKSAHLVDVPGNSSDASPIYYDELGEPVYVQTYSVLVNGINKNKHLIQLPVSVNLEKVRKLVEGPCPTILLKADTKADVNLLNSTTFDQIICDRSVLQPSTLRMDAYGSSRVEVLGNLMHSWDGKGKYTGNPSMWQQPIHHLICCPEMYATLWEWWDHVIQWTRQTDQIYRQHRHQICKQIYKAHTWQICKQIYKAQAWQICKRIYSTTNHGSTS